MNDRIYPKLSIEHWKYKVELAAARRALKEFKNMDDKSNGFIACGLSFNELMKELNNE